MYLKAAHGCSEFTMDHGGQQLCKALASLRQLCLLSWAFLSELCSWLTSRCTTALWSAHCQGALSIVPVSCPKCSHNLGSRALPRLLNSLFSCLTSCCVWCCLLPYWLPQPCTSLLGLLDSFSFPCEQRNEALGLYIVLLSCALCRF